jgi:hypothetical protein
MRRRTTMQKNTAKSIRAGVVGFIVGAVLSFGTDAILENAGILPRGNLYVAPSLIVVVLLYRLVYNAIGCYIVAWLAPRNPMKHALFLGGFGTLLSVLGAIATADMNLGPAWYAWTLAVLTMPSAWIGGKVFLARRKAGRREQLSMLDG